MKWIKFSFVFTFLIFCFNAYSSTPNPVLVSSPYSQNAQALKVESRIESAILLRCLLVKENMNDAKSVMMKRNSLFRNACGLYQGWSDLFRQSSCKDPDAEVPENFSCDTAAASACQEVNALEAEAWRWMDLGYRGCVSSFWESGCQKLNIASNQCQAVGCAGACHPQYDCSLDGFIRTLGSNPHQDKSVCIRDVERSRYR